MSRRAWTALDEFLRAALHHTGTPILVARELAHVVLASGDDAMKVQAAAWLDVLVPTRLPRPENDPAFIEALDRFRKSRPECQALAWWECVGVALEDEHTQVSYRQRRPRRWAA